MMQYFKEYQFKKRMKLLLLLVFFDKVFVVEDNVNIVKLL